MKRALNLALAYILSALATQSALASDNGGTKAQSAYGVIGPFGLSAGYAHRFADHWVSRLQVNSGSLVNVKTHDTISDVRYELKQKTGAGISTFTDYYPSLDSGWRLTGGFIVSTLKADLTGQPNGQGNYSINGHTYSSAQVGTLTGRVKFNPVNVYLGGGWESAPIEQKGWRFTSDAGLFYAGKASARLSASGAAGNSALQADINAERSQLEEQGLGAMVSLGAAYSF